MAIKPGAKFVAHTRLAVEAEGKITLFNPADVITVGGVVSPAQAEEWIERGSAALLSPEDLKAEDAAHALAARAEAVAAAALKPAPETAPAAPAAGE